MNMSSDDRVNALQGSKNVDLMISLVVLRQRLSLLQMYIILGSPNPKKWLSFDFVGTLVHYSTYAHNIPWHVPKLVRVDDKSVNDPGLQNKFKGQTSAK